MKTKKILALSCSPSHGWNSDTMLDSFIAGAEKVKGTEIKKIYITDIKCDNYSFENKTGPREHEEDLKKLLNEIETSNAIVIATPTYNFAVPAGIKNIIDRMRPIALDMSKTNILMQPTGKLDYIKTFFIVSGGTPWWAQKLLFPIFPPLWLKVVFKYYGAKNKGSIYAGSLKASTLAKNNKGLLKKCARLGKSFAKKI